MRLFIIIFLPFIAFIGTSITVALPINESLLEGLKAAPIKFTLSYENGLGKLLNLSMAIRLADLEQPLENVANAPPLGQEDQQLKMESMLNGGLINWGDSVNQVLEEGSLLVKETTDLKARGFVRALLAGPKNSGKTFIAANIMSTFPFPLIRIFSPKEMIGWDEAVKVAELQKVFADAYKAPISCIIIDDIEFLLDTLPISQSSLAFKALLVLLGKRPPKDHRLLVLATTSYEEKDLPKGLIKSFNGGIIHVKPLSSRADLLAVLKHSGAFTSKECEQIERKLITMPIHLGIGIKRLLEIIDHVRQYERDQQMKRLLDALYKEFLDNKLEEK